MRIEEAFSDVLQNIEFGIVSTYREHPDLVDHDVLRTLDAVMDSYKAEKIGRAPREVSLSRVEQAMFLAVRTMCEWRLGRRSLDGAEGDIRPDSTPKTVDEILLCLKRIHKSVQGWNRSGGQRGYLDFIVKYVR